MSEVLILANGEFPSHQSAIKALEGAKRVVCCDGAADKLLNYGRKADYIIGDLDSISQKLKTDAIELAEQDTNDLTKAVNFCLQNKWTKITVLGATNEREDHSLANIFLLSKYCQQAKIQYISNYARIKAYPQGDHIIKSFKEQKISIFCPDPASKIESTNLFYSLNGVTFDELWKGSLNKSTANEIHLSIKAQKPVIVIQNFA